ncbi:MAG: hypothetical protein RL021_633 [Bacteroidota bacterium]
MRRMKNQGILWLFLFCLTTALMNNHKASASHTMGADLTYTHVGGNSYRVTLSFYRDCAGIPAPTSVPVKVLSASCGDSLGVVCNPRTGSGREITPNCSNAVTTCNGGTFTGIQEWIYDGVVTLPNACSDWTFSYNLCCRNAAVTNISNPTAATFYIYATLNNTSGRVNNSPDFTNNPVPFLCLGQQFAFNHGAYDSDGDSLVFQLITPQRTATTNVVYIAPFSATNPLSSSPATSFNPVNGDIIMTPQNMEVTVMAVLVKEYRNGVLIGTVERDLQLTVMTCSNNLPSLTGINGTNNFTIDVCAGQQVCFDVFSSDADSAQRVTIEWNNSIPGASLSQSTGTRPSARFCWTPSEANAGNTYTFTAQVKDDACPYIGTQVYAYTIRVTGVRTDIVPSFPTACSGIATLNAAVTGGNGVYNYLWNNGATTSSIVAGAGSWSVTVSDGRCSSTDTFTVNTPIAPIAAFTFPAQACTGAPLIFNDASTSGSGTITGWHWNFGDGSVSTAQNPVHAYTSSGDYVAYLIIENSSGCNDTVVQSVTVGEQPNASFTTMNGCAGTAFNFSNLDASSADAWTWDFGNGTGSSAASATVTYLTAGNYSVTLTGTSANGCSASLTRNVSVYPYPTANAGADRNLCIGSSTILSTSGNDTYTWIPGGTGTSMTVQPTSTTTYVLIATSANGCSSSDTVTVAVLPTPVVNTGNDVTSCNGQTVNLSASGANNYSWMPGGMTGSNVTVSPSSTVTYTVTGTNSYGCSASDVVTVLVSQTPVINAGADITICQGAGATLSASGGTNYFWDVTGQTSSSIRVTPSWTTTYTVSATDSGACSGSDYVTVTVLPAPQVQLQPFFLCAGSTVTLNSNVTASSYSWTPGGQSTPSISVSQGGVYGLTVTDANGCTASSSATVTTGTTLSVNLSDITFCKHDTVVLDAGNPGCSYLWAPGGETTQSISIQDGGTYSVTVTDPGGCTGSVTITATETPRPVAYWTATTSCEGSPTTFTNMSSVVGLNNNRYHWNFGDGGHSSLENPTYTYTQPGRYPVHLTIQSGNGCSAPYNGWVYVNPLPEVSFNVQDLCNGSTAVFTNLSTVSMGNITGYHWDFGDGDTSNAINPSHQYTATGAMTVTLTVTTSGGCTSTLQRTINVYPNPVAAVTGGSACNGVALTPGNGSSIASGMITGYYWNFGDGFTSVQQNPSHVYAAPGNYTMTLTVVSADGCSDTATATTTVYPNPIANAGPDRNICPGGSIALSATGGSTYYWLPSNISGASFSVTPASTTTYTVIVTDNHGCIASDVMTVNVSNRPIVRATGTTSICAGQTAVLTGSGSGTLSWNPGGMTTGTVTVQPSTTTDYVLTVTDLNGCTANDTIRVQVNPSPVLAVSPNQAVCYGSSVTLYASGAFNYAWSPIGSNGPAVSLTPTVTGTYTVVGTSLQGCTSTATVNVTVNQAPQVSLMPAFYCQGHTAVLDAGNPGSSYLWSNGQTTQSINVSTSGNYSVVVTGPNGCPATASTTVIEGGNLQALPSAEVICSGASTVLNAGNPGSSYLWSNGATTQTITASNAGTYSVTITDAFGCSATINHLVSVNPLPTAAFTAQPVCAGTPMSFVNQSTVSAGSISQLQWNFGNGSYSNQAAPNYLFNTPGTYQVGLTVTTSAGCSATTSGTVVIHPNPTADFSTTTSCLGSPTQFADASTGNITSWSWSFGDNSAGATNTAPVHTYSSAGSYDATLTVATAQGCRDSISRYLTVYGLPNPIFTATNACTAENIILQNMSTSSWGNISAYSWNFGDGTVTTGNATQHTYAAAGNYTIQLTATTVYGCTQSTTRTITSYPLPTASFSAPAACAGSPVNFDNTSTVQGGNIAFSAWNLGGGINSTLNEPIWSYSGAGTYPVSLVVISGNGCRDTVNGTVQIHPLPTPSFTAPDVCLNSATSFTDLSTISSGTVTVWNWDFGDNTVGSGSTAAHTYGSAGTYTVELTAVSDQGCIATIRSTTNIYPNPEVSFTSENVCFGTPVQFINTSTVSGGGAVTSNWIFSNGTTTSSVNPTIIFTNAGSYQAMLTVTSATGCSAQSTGQLQVYELPQAAFTTTGNCENSAILLTNQSVSQDGIIDRSVWFFGDGGASTAQNPSHTFTSAGQYTTRLFITTEFGCRDTAIRVLTINEQPAPVISANNACVGAPINLSATGTDLTGYNWTFSNGTTSSDSTLTQTFLSAGIQTVGLSVTNSYGCSGNTSLNITIYPNPVAGFTVNPVCIGDRSIFSNISNITSGAISSYAWVFGDGQQSSAIHPNHIFQSPGTYQATLTAVSDHGCSNTFNSITQVHGLPVVDFSTGVQGCSPVLFTPSDLSVSTDGIITGWLWDFGDGVVSTDENPSHTYTSSGNFSVALSVVSNFGCQAHLSQPGFVTVFPEPGADFSMTGNTTDLNPLVQFTNLSTGYSAFQWNFGDGVTDNTNMNPTHMYSDLGTYTITLSTVNSFGCRDTVQKVIEVRPTSTLYAPNCFTPNGDGKNDVFKPEFTNMTDIEVWVFDRWGLLISKFDGMNDFWDGYHKGRKCQTDTYVYKIKGKGIEGKDYEWVGHVSIVY